MVAADAKMAVMERATSACCHCGRAYQGRGIYADHGLGQYNLEKHQSACLGQQKRRAAVAGRKKLKVAQRYRRSLEIAARRNAAIVPPLPGQFGFPFDGVPAIVA